MNWESLCSGALLGSVGVQGLAFLALGALMLLGRALTEKTVIFWIRSTYVAAFLLACVADVSLFASGLPRVTVPVGRWVLSPELNFDFVLQLDRLSAPFLLLATALCGAVAKFSSSYMHREVGFRRFFLLLCLFGFGDALTVLSGSVEVLYFSWELLGLTSALLIAYFHERQAPLRNALYAFIVYRLCDLGLVLASVSISSQFVNGDFSSFLGNGVWPHQVSPLTQAGATTVGLFFLLAAMGKAAQAPFSGWLPRAMEGPTPSTAIFYGALSIHAGAYMLLRFGPVLDAAPLVGWLCFFVGLSTALLARLTGRVQTDVKTTLAYASLGQVGLIFAEIGLGFRWLPLLHAIGNCLLRSVQFLRAPSVLHERHELRSALNDASLRPSPEHATAAQKALYRAGLERGYLDNALERWAVLPFMSVCRFLIRLDRAVLRLVGGEEPS